MTYKSLHDLESQLNKAAKLYRAKNYEDAYPLLTELSQWGFKHAQMLLGDMYLHGSHVEQSTGRGLAWLGVAKEAKTERQASKIFKHVYSQLNKEQKTYVDNMVDDYIAKYGVKAQNFKCRKRTSVGSNIPQKTRTKMRNSNSVLHPIS